MKSENRCGAGTSAIYQWCIDASVSFVKLSGLVRCRMGRYLPVATPRLGQRRRTQTAKLGCGWTPRVSYDPLGEKSGSLGTPCCRTGFCVRRNKEPICDSQIRWIRASVLPIRRGDCCCSPKTNNFLCPRTRPIIRTQKRPHFALTGKKQAFLMLTFSDWRWLRQPTRCVQQYTSKEKVGPFLYVILYLGNPAIRRLCAVQRICLET